jgi:nitrogen regulatory protein PII
MQNQNIKKIGDNLYTATVEEEDGELLLNLPDEMLEEMGWEVGTTIEWIDIGDGRWMIRRVDDEKNIRTGERGES